VAIALPNLENVPSRKDSQSHEHQKESRALRREAVLRHNPEGTSQGDSREVQRKRN